MPSLPIVENLDVLEQPCAKRIEGPVVLRVDEFHLQAAEERLHHGVVPAVPLAAHAAY